MIFILNQQESRPNKSSFIPSGGLVLGHNPERRAQQTERPAARQHSPTLSGVVAGKPWEPAFFNHSGNGMFHLRSDFDAPHQAARSFFSFLDQGEEFSGYQVQPSVGDSMPGPHIHVHWTDEDGEQQVEMLMKGFALNLEIGQPQADGSLPATMSLEIPTVNVKLDGGFTLPAHPPVAPQP